MPELIFSNYKKEYAKDFKQINMEWIEKYFVMEPVDEFVLTNPEEAILKPGGIIPTMRWGKLSSIIVLSRMAGSALNSRCQTL